MNTQDYKLKVSKDDKSVAYLTLPGHPGTKLGIVERTVSLRELIGDYSGPDIYVDFDQGNRAIGIELVG